MAQPKDFSPLFDRLKAILKPYEPHLTVEADGLDGYSLNGHYSEYWKRVLYFGGVQVRKTYVSFYLMPVYLYPDLLDGISPSLRKRMQGKSCFNFSRVDEALFDELGGLVKKGFEKIRQERLAGRL
jgi:hypothetical protein